MDAFNYKGQYYDDDGKEIEEEKYTCPLTGAHFRFTEICGKLKKIQKERLKEEGPEIKKKWVADMLTTQGSTDRSSGSKGRKAIHDQWQILKWREQLHVSEERP